MVGMEKYVEIVKGVAIVQFERYASKIEFLDQ